MIYVNVIGITYPQKPYLTSSMLHNFGMILNAWLQKRLGTSYNNFMKKPSLLSAWNQNSSPWNLKIYHITHEVASNSSRNTTSSPNISVNSCTDPKTSKTPSSKGLELDNESFSIEHAKISIISVEKGGWIESCARIHNFKYENWNYQWQSEDCCNCKIVGRKKMHL